MKLGAFSISLSVKDINASKTFYEQLGFEYKAGNIDQKWLVLKNGQTVIGLFQGMFENNILTFNPGWDQEAGLMKEFDDVREIQKDLQSKGLGFITKAETESEGPASFMIADPDGNMILFDQHR